MTPVSRCRTRQTVLRFRNDGITRWLERRPVRWEETRYLERSA
jgi:hypothetical protein